MDVLDRYSCYSTIIHSRTPNGRLSFPLHLQNHPNGWAGWNYPRMCRANWIRTSGLFVPNEARYLTALQPELGPILLLVENWPPKRLLPSWPAGTFGLTAAHHVVLQPGGVLPCWRIAGRIRPSINTPEPWARWWESFSHPSGELPHLQRTPGSCGVLVCLFNTGKTP